MVTNGRRQRLRLALAVCVSAFMTLMSAAIQPASAQEFRGTVTGTVTDPGGLPLPGATVTAVNTTTNETATAVTSGDGLYNLPFLKPGLYTLTVELEGFRKHTQEKVQLEVGSTITLAIQMQIGSISETVTVVSEAVEATKADRGMVIDNTARDGAAAQRAQSVHAVVPGAGHHLQRTGDLSAAVRQRRDRRLVDQRRRRTATTNSCSTARRTTRSRAATTSPTCRRSTRCRSSRSSPTATTRSTAAPPAASSTCR